MRALLLSMAVLVLSPVALVPQAGLWARATAEEPAPAGGASPEKSAPATPATPAEAAQWPMEELRSKDGSVWRGLLLSNGKGQREFAEIVRPRGRPMYAVIRPVDPESVLQLQRLPEKERAKLAERLDKFRRRARIEMGRMERVELARATVDGRSYRRYVGQWFVLDSTADDATTRRCVVRIEQMFRAYRQLLPPRTGPRCDLRVLLFGTMAGYQHDLRRRGLAIENAAFFSPEENLIVAGSDLVQLAAHLAAARAHHDTVRRQYEALDADMPTRLARLRRQLEAAGFTREEIDDEIRARKTVWAKQFKDVLRKLDEANRRNEAKFSQMNRRFFTRIYHEAFHAYLENFVYPHKKCDVPNWLNEGLAQVFQSGQLDVDTLRTDAPDRRALKALKADLESKTPLGLAELLAAGPKVFRIAHEAENRSSNRYYVYSWGLAYYLTFQQPVVGSEALDRFVAAEAAGREPAARFEELVGMSLREFERRWRTAMLSLKPAPRNPG